MKAGLYSIITLLIAGLSTTEDIALLHSGRKRPVSIHWSIARQDTVQLLIRRPPSKIIFGIRS